MRYLLVKFAYRLFVSSLVEAGKLLTRLPLSLSLASEYNAADVLERVYALVESGSEPRLVSLALALLANSGPMSDLAMLGEGVTSSSSVSSSEDSSLDSSLLSDSFEASIGGVPARPKKRFENLELPLEVLEVVVGVALVLELAPAAAVDPEADDALARRVGVTSAGGLENLDANSLAEKPAPVRAGELLREEAVDDSPEVEDSLPDRC